MSSLGWLCLSLPLGVCRRAHVLLVLVVFVFTSMKTCALLQTPRGKDKHNQHK
jgi:hypothetical protein